MSEEITLVIPKSNLNSLKSLEEFLKSKSVTSDAKEFIGFHFLASESNVGSICNMEFTVDGSQQSSQFEVGAISGIRGLYSVLCQGSEGLKDKVSVKIYNVKACYKPPEPPAVPYTESGYGSPSSLFGPKTPNVADTEQEREQNILEVKFTKNCDIEQLRAELFKTVDANSALSVHFPKKPIEVYDIKGLTIVFSSSDEGVPASAPLRSTRATSRGKPYTRDMLSKVVGDAYKGCQHEEEKAEFYDTLKVTYCHNENKKVLDDMIDSDGIRFTTV